MDDLSIEARMHSLLQEHPILLFMKGSPEKPFCGFSRTIVVILQQMATPFAFIDVLLEPELRQAIKIFSQWPTFPQLYVHGTLVGGCDIVRDLYESGDLAAILADKGQHG